VRVAVINLVGLSRSLLGEHMPGLTRFAERNGLQSFKPAFPAVTCTAQSSMVTGKPVSVHGVVANGWYDRESAEVKFWKQSNHLVRGEKIWDRLRREVPGFTCAKLFWWYNMYSTADYAVTPRPLYPADGRKFFDVHTQPMGMREEIKKDLGPFPFPAFWGPGAGIASSEWIAASAKWVEEKHSPTLSLVYLPHLDYCLQKDGPNAPNIPVELRNADRVATDLIDYYESRQIRVIVLSEYGISPVDQPVHLNRLFRKRGWIQIKDELGLETLDCGGSKVFAVADHQVAHVYVNDRSLLGEVKAMLEATPGVETVLKADEVWQPGAGKERGGDLVAISKENSWFTYYFWENDDVAPDYARTIDIHRKPGYDPCELFIDPKIRVPKLKIAKFLLKKKLGIRGLLDVIPLDASRVKGSHGRSNVSEEECPVVMGASCSVSSAERIYDAIYAAVKGEQLTLDSDSKEPVKSGDGEG
jgi:predicted AlkP superfamily pyrophosphatase or phosphodiesterase